MSFVKITPFQLISKPEFELHPRFVRRQIHPKSQPSRSRRPTNGGDRSSATKAPLAALPSDNSPAKIHGQAPAAMKTPPAALSPLLPSASLLTHALQTHWRAACVLPNRKLSPRSRRRYLRPTGDKKGVGSRGNCASAGRAWEESLCS